MSTTDADLSALARTLGLRLLERGEWVALAESCTGGLVAKVLTDIPGSSAWFERGLVTYSNLAKHELLGVPMALFETQGAVSEACVTAMASGLMAHSPAHWGVAITGIAGPGGGSPDKPVGTVWIAWVQRGSPLQSQRFVFAGDRESVRQQSAQRALEELLHLV
ncbi:MAG: CinA family protein [Panacagrimonas sp.]